MHRKCKRQTQFCVKFLTGGCLSVVLSVSRDREIKSPPGLQLAEVIFVGFINSYCSTADIDCARKWQYITSII